MATDAELTQALVARIVKAVEPVTRFDRNTLEFTGAVVRTVDGTGVWRQAVTFSQSSVASAGKLPSAIRNEGHAAQLNAAMGEVQERCEKELPARLRAWMEDHAQTFTVLGTADVFDGPYVRGFEHNCGTCNGAGRLTCHGCGGRGTRECSNCGGSTRVRCYSCSGSGRTSCGQCGGRGQWSEQKSRQAYNYSNNTSYTEYYTEYQRCWSCGASGQQNCSNCSGNGKVNCLQCSNGRVTCGTCGGGGQLTCSSCGGTGRQHTLRTLSCKVGFDFTSRVNDDREEVRTTVAGLSMRDLHALAPLVFSRAETGQAHAQRDYTLQLPTVSVKAGLGAAARTVIGYGTQAQVFDMKGLVSVLLMGDLEVLEASLARKPGSEALATAMDLVFLSEAHIAIAKHPHDGKTALHPELEAMAVTSDHAARFTKAVRTAVERLMRRRLFYGWTVLVLTPAVVLLAGMYTGQPLRWALGVPLGLLVVSGLAWRWLVERPAVNGLGRRYEHVGVKGMQEIAKATRATRHWKRWGPWVAVLLLGGAAYLASVHTRLDTAARTIIYGHVPELRPVPPPPQPTALERFMQTRVVYNQQHPGIRSYLGPFVVGRDTLTMPDGRPADVSLRPQPDRKKDWAALVRCRWVPALDAPIELGEKERLKALSAFEKKYRVKCIVVLGVGGTPEIPAQLFVIPLDRKIPEQLDGPALAKYAVPVDWPSTRFDRVKGRMGMVVKKK